MGDIINIQKTSQKTASLESELLDLSDNLLSDASTKTIKESVTVSMPIAELGTLGAGVASLLPAFRTITQTVTLNSGELYRLVNAEVGDVLKGARNGNLWGALKTAEGYSKMAQFQLSGPSTVTAEAVAAINPAIMMMAVALFSIEKELGNIADMEKQIISFLQMEKEAEIIGDIKTLTSIISSYKYNWDNERYVSGNHNIVLAIQRTAYKNLVFYQKQADDAINKNNLIVAQSRVRSALETMLKKFKYYRLSLYSYSLASMLEVMLSRNFNDDNICNKQSEIETNSIVYRELFGKCSVYLERMCRVSVETNVLKGIGAAGNAVGNFIGKIPVVEKGQVDEFLQEKGSKLKSSANEIEREIVLDFAEIADPCTALFIEKFKDMSLIYNHTEQICFDDKNIYLIAG